MDRDNKDLLVNIIVDLLFALPSQMLGPTGLKKKLEKKKKKEKKKRELEVVWTVLLTYAFTQLWFVVSGVVYSGIELTTIKR